MKLICPLVASALLALLAACHSSPVATSSDRPGALTASVDGPGFFTFTDAANRTIYTREARLALSADRELASADGSLLVSPRIVVPCDASLLQIDTEGVVTAWIGGEAIEIGRLEVIAFANPERLTALGHGRYTQASDAPDGFTLIPLSDAPARITATAASPEALAQADDR